MRVSEVEKNQGTSRKSCTPLRRPKRGPKLRSVHNDGMERKPRILKREALVGCRDSVRRPWATASDGLGKGGKEKTISFRSSGKKQNGNCFRIVTARHWTQDKSSHGNQPEDATIPSSLSAAAGTTDNGALPELDTSNSKFLSLQQPLRRSSLLVSPQLTPIRASARGVSLESLHFKPGILPQIEGHKLV